MGKRKRGPKYRFIQRKGEGWRGWYTIGPNRYYCQKRATEKEAHDDALLAREMQKIPEAGARTLKRAFDLIYEDLKVADRRPATKRWYADQFAGVCRVFKPGTLLGRVGRHELKEFIRIRRKQGAGDTTIDYQLQALGRAFKLAGREGWTDVNPVQLITRPTRRAAPVVALEWSKLMRLLERIRDSHTHKSDGNVDADLALFLFATGIRKSELAELIPGSLDVEGRRLSLPHTKTDGGGDELPLPDEALELATRIRDRSGEHVIPGTTKSRRDGYIRRTFDRWKYLEPKFRPHVMRHSLGRHLERCGVSLDLRAAALRHESAVRQIVTMRYSRPFDEDLRKAFALAWYDVGQSTPS